MLKTEPEEYLKPPVSNFTAVQTLCPYILLQKEKKKLAVQGQQLDIWPASKSSERA
jgi:hypothetical protein